MTAQVQATEQGNLFKRRAKPWQRIFLDVGMTALTATSSIFAIFVLALILYYVFTRGIERLSWQTLTQLPPPPGDQAGGFGNAVLGTIIVVSIAISITFPIGLFAAIYLSEFGKNSPAASFLRFIIKVLTGVPSIIAGVFAYGVLVLSTKTFSALAGGMALSVLTLPIIILSCEEALRLVPADTRAAAYALGASRVQTVFRVVLPAALPVILTGVTLAIARAAGETAPLIFTALFSFLWPSGLLKPVASLAVLIYNFALVPFENQQKLAWGGALALVILALITTVSFRLLVSRRQEAITI
ncbi:phosphate ABC transporter permease PstA [Synechococcus sp. WC10meta]|uniref:phosphate ABC transporter permease PstA n=1 Tax=Synechococcus sp. WC10meta TaxID=2964537 RepID=UPI0039C0A361